MGVIPESVGPDLVGPPGHVEEFGLHFPGTGKPLKGSKQRKGAVMKRQ